MFVCVLSYCAPKFAHFQGTSIIRSCHVINHALLPLFLTTIVINFYASLCTFMYNTCFSRDADETIAWIQEKDALLSSDDYGRDLASVQALQRKHEGVERDLAALEEKVRFGS